ncbi:MAG: FUSC family protein [Turicibacter sp.]
MKQKIFSKTIVFIFVMLFISGFKSIFGESNTLVGVMTLVLTLVAMGRNLTTHAGKNLLIILAINLVLGVGAFIVTQNIWLGLIINFIIMFLIAYVFSFELRKPLNMLVGLHYILMMTNPILPEQLPTRIAALVAGPFILMGVQMLLNKNKFKKQSPALLKKIENNLVTKINLIKQNQEIAEINQLIISDINQVKVMVHEITKINSQVPLVGRTVIACLSCLERINLVLDQSCDSRVLNGVELSLKEKKKFMIEMEDHNVTDSELRNIKEFITIFDLLQKEQETLNHLIAEPSMDYEKNEKVAETFKEKHILKRNFNHNPIRFGYGIRLGILVALTSFITTYFNLEYGVWLVYTVFAITQPFIEFTVTKAKKRMVGTIVGASVVFILFSLIQDNSLRMMILLMAGYLMSYMTDYRNIVIFITMASICSAGIEIANPSFIVLNRLFYIFIGIVIAVIVNKIFLKSTYADEEKGILNLKKDMLTYMFNEIYVNERGGEKTMDHLYLIPSFIESRIEHWDLDISEERLVRQRWLMNDLHQVHLQLNTSPASEKIINQIKQLIKSESKDIVISKLEVMIGETKDLNEWKLYSQSLTLIQQIETV